MAASENKTRPTEIDPAAFAAAIEQPQQRADSLRLIEIMSELTGEPPVMWGSSIIGFGRYHYRYDSGHEGDAPLLGFSPRKGKFAIYLVGEFDGRFAEPLSRLGKHKAAKACLYINRLSDVDEAVLRELLRGSADRIRELYP